MHIQIHVATTTSCLYDTRMIGQVYAFFCLLVLSLKLELAGLLPVNDEKQTNNESMGWVDEQLQNSGEQ